MLIVNYAAAVSALIGMCSGLSVRDYATPNKCLTNGKRCPLEAFSCSSPGVDSCCTPKYGMMVMAYSWSHQIGPSDKFTIHGLWPNYCNGTYLPNAGCDATRVYPAVGDMVKKVSKETYDFMDKYWLANNGDNDSFWTHEWNKHGTCLNTIDPNCYTVKSYSPEKNVVDYFDKAIALYQKYDFTTILAKHNIVATANTTDSSITKKYTKKQVTDAIKAETGFESVVYCSKGTLSEIWMYFYMRNNDEYVYTPFTKGEDKCDNFTFIKKYSQPY
ncbi:hypothetical protein BB561_000270 [Smittium simulii]|uniref:ribonuclease T2 n=1 Tax=Smittium simulii TaxID=133385 RepID=A0A2T9YZW3_9FUNG|nr:hypothetical protein BB561_000270 [Smittium simulii]